MLCCVLLLSVCDFASTLLLLTFNVYFWCLCFCTWQNKTCHKQSKCPKPEIVFTKGVESRYSKASNCSSWALCGCAGCWKKNAQILSWAAGDAHSWQYSFTNTSPTAWLHPATRCLVPIFCKSPSCYCQLRKICPISTAGKFYRWLLRSASQKLTNSYCAAEFLWKFTSNF